MLLAQAPAGVESFHDPATVAALALMGARDCCLALAVAQVGPMPRRCAAARTLMRARDFRRLARGFLAAVQHLMRRALHFLVVRDLLVLLDSIVDRVRSPH